MRLCIYATIALLSIFANSAWAFKVINGSDPRAGNGSQLELQQKEKPSQNAAVNDEKRQSAALTAWRSKVRQGQRVGVFLTGQMMLSNWLRIYPNGLQCLNLGGEYVVERRGTMIRTDQNQWFPIDDIWPTCEGDEGSSYMTLEQYGAERRWQQLSPEQKRQLSTLNEWRKTIKYGASVAVSDMPQYTNSKIMMASNGLQCMDIDPKDSLWVFSVLSENVVEVRRDVDQYNYSSWKVPVNKVYPICGLLNARLK